MNGFLQSLKLLGPVRLAALGGVGLATLLGLFVLALQLGNPSMTTLYRGLSPEDGGAIVQRLEQMNVPYQASADGTRISVAEDQMGRVKMILAQEGLPSGGGVGYEIFNQPEGFGTSSFLQNINQQRAMEGELARTIRNMQGVGNARVQLVLPRRELFARESAEARASVFLELRGASMDRQQISAIQHLIASAVPQLSPDRVAIIDSRGNLLAAGTGRASADAMQDSAEQQRLSIEQRLSQRIEEILGRTVGFEKVRAEVTVELDMDSITTQSETYDPESAVARSTQSVTEKNETNEPSTGDASVSVANNLPNGQTGTTAPAAAAGSTPTSRNNRSEETTNFEISKTVQNHVRAAGSVKRLSVAVLVDGIYTTEGEGAEAKQVYKPRPQAELDQYAALVRSAVGFDANRGDTVEVANLQFVKDEASAKSDMLTKITENPKLMSIAQNAIFGVLGLVILLLFVRPLVKSLLDVKTQTEEQLLAASANTPQLTAPDMAALTDQSDAADNVPDSMIDINRVDGRVKASSLKKMGEIIDKHPEEAVAIIRQWIYAES